VASGPPFFLVNDCFLQRLQVKGPVLCVIEWNGMIKVLSAASRKGLLQFENWLVTPAAQKGRAIV